MIILQVVPHDVVTMMQDEGIPLTALRSADKMAEVLSVHDMAEISLARSDFPFSFDPELNLEMASSVLVELATDESRASLYNRVNERITTLKLRREAQGDSFCPVFTLYPVDESLWVAALQRQPSSHGDPMETPLPPNHGFFDGMMAHALHHHPFERVCSTNLFTYYLGSIAV